jgi:HSP90 family molecular chaperone
MKRDPELYSKWFDEFNIFLKEGVMSDSENQEQLLRLMRYNTSFGPDSISLEDYVKSMKEGQKKVYYVSG